MKMGAAPAPHFFHTFSRSRTSFSYFAEVPALPSLFKELQNANIRATIRATRSMRKWHA
jgi:hypothetical protein